jgi:hypothetical protein
MDLTEYHASYMKGVNTNLGILRACLLNMREAPMNSEVIKTAARAAHSIKGSSWTMREVPVMLNDEPPDSRYDNVADIAERLEHHLGVSSQHSIELLIEELAELEGAVQTLRSNRVPT